MAGKVLSGEPERTFEQTPRPRRGRSLSWFSVVLLLVAIVLGLFYWQRARMPAKIVIAGGTDGGRYASLASAIAAELSRRHECEVEVRSTTGSVENIRLLENHEVSLGLYQSGTLQVLGKSGQRPGDAAPAAFVSNLYSEYLIPVGRSVGDVSVIADDEHHGWSSNGRFSGDFAAARLLQDHIGVDSEEITSVTYADIPRRLSENEIDVAIVCCGLAAPALGDLLRSSDVRLLPIPAPDAFARKFTMLSADVIPQGYFSTAPMIPSQDFSTVSFRAQLLADSQASVRLVEEVAAIISDAAFQRREGLAHLLDQGTDYATMRPEFELHPGAEHVFYPELKPLVNPDFVEGTEGLRSFLVSLIVAAWLLQRWWKRRQLRGQEHRLDRYIRDLLQLERDQMEVDGDSGPEDGAFLQALLDKVTVLRQEALAEFTAHELNEDNAVDCFIQMCHALSDKINAKLTRNVILQNGHQLTGQQEALNPSTEA